jgi:hypothetical protein
MLKRSASIALLCILLLAVSSPASLVAAIPSAAYTKSGRLCIPTAEMQSLEAAIGKNQLAVLEKAGAALEIKGNASDGYLLQNGQIGIALTIPRYTPPKQTRLCQPDAMFDQSPRISAAYILSFADVLRFRESYKWPIEGEIFPRPPR